MVVRYMTGKTAAGCPQPHRSLARSLADAVLTHQAPSPKSRRRQTASSTARPHMILKVGRPLLEQSLASPS